MLASSSASATENSPTVNSRSRSSSPAAAEQLAHAGRAAARARRAGRAPRRPRRARRPSPSAGPPAPSRVSASRTVSILRGSAKKAELTWRSSAIDQADVGADDPLEILEGGLGRRQLASACSEATAPAAASPAARAGEELALEVREAEHAAARELVGVGDAGGDEHEAALGRARRSARAARRRRARLTPTLTIRSARAARRRPRSRRARARSPPAPSACGPLEPSVRIELSTARARSSSGGSRASRPPRRAARAELEQLGGLEAAQRRRRRRSARRRRPRGDRRRPASARPPRPPSGPAGRRRGAEVAIDPCQPAPAAHGARVDGPQAAVRVAAAQDPGPADRRGRPGA